MARPQAARASRSGSMTVRHSRSKTSPRALLRRIGRHSGTRRCRFGRSARRRPSSRHRGRKIAGARGAGGRLGVFGVVEHERQVKRCGALSLPPKTGVSRRASTCRPAPCGSRTGLAVPFGASATIVRSSDPELARASRPDDQHVDGIRPAERGVRTGRGGRLAGAPKPVRHFASVIPVPSDGVLIGGGTELSWVRSPAGCRRNARRGHRSPVLLPPGAGLHVSCWETRSSAEGSSAACA